MCIRDSCSRLPSGSSSARRTLSGCGLCGSITPVSYTHLFKGDYYLVEDVAKDSETGEEYVVYRKLYGDGSLWLRPKDMFLSEV